MILKPCTALGLCKASFLRAMKILIAPDSYKGTRTAAQAAAAIADGFANSPNSECLLMPVADGGEGTVDAFLAAGSLRVFVDDVEDALGRKRRATYAISSNGTAVIESAEAVGLCHIEPKERNICLSDSRGLARLLRHAATNGCKHIVVGLGGSATNDGGCGMLKALGYTISEQGIDGSKCEACLDNVCIDVLCDVQAPFCGPQGATMVFARQKGADEETIAQLELKMQHLAELMKKSTGIDVATMPGAGAAGGLGGAFAACLGARLLPGISTILDVLDFDRALDGTNLVITGEGSIDSQSLMGKATVGVLERANKKNIPTIAIAGRVEDRAILLAAGFADVIQITPLTTSHTQNLTLTVKNMLLKKYNQYWR